MAPVLIWPNIAIVENVVFQEILALTKLQHTGSSKMVIVQKILEISNILMQMICDIPEMFEKWNSHANFIHTSHNNR